MSNVVEIVVRARDATGDAVSRVGRRFAGLGSKIGGMLSKLGGFFKNLAEKGMEAFKGIGSSLAGLAKSGPAAIGPILAVLTLLPVAAGAAAAAITLGLGAAIAGIGIMAAAQAPKVKEAFADMKANIVAQAKDISKPFETSLIKISHIAQNTFSKLTPSLERAFQDIAPALTRFASSVGRGLGSLGPVISGITKNFTPLLDSLGGQMPGLLARLGDAFKEISDAASPRFVTMLVDAFEIFIVVLGRTIAILAEIGDKFAWVWDKFKAIPGLKGLMNDVGTSTAEFGGAVDGVGKSADTSAKSIQHLKEKITELANNALSSRDAARAFEESIDAAGAAVRKNGRSLDINTEKGRANQSALDGIAKSALVMRDAMEKNGQDSGRAMDRARASFIRVARQMGMTKGEAARLADQFGLVRVGVNRIPGSKTIKVRQLGVGAALRNSHRINQAVRQIPRDWVTYHRVMRIGDSIKASHQMKATGGIVGAAGGGPRSAMTLVGEQGPELVRLPFGSTVIPNGQTEAMLGGAGAGGGPLMVTLMIGDTELGDILLDPLRRMVWTRGGNVQAVLGDS